MESLQKDLVGLRPEDLFWGGRSLQASQKIVDHQVDGGKLYFFYLARGKRDKKGLEPLV